MLLASSLSLWFGLKFVGFCRPCKCSHAQAQVFRLVLSIQRLVPAMPGKRVSVAAGLNARGPAKKPARASTGPLVACAKMWGSAGWVFKGLQDGKTWAVSFS